MDWAHRALQPPQQNSLRRVIVVKPHVYKAMRRSWEADALTIQGHPVQIFADLSPYIIQKRRSLKPLLQVLNQKHV